MFSIKESAIFAPPYVGEVKKVFEVFSPAIILVHQGKNLIGNGFVFANGWVVSPCDTRNPNVKFQDGTLCPSVSSGDHGQILRTKVCPVDVPCWRYEEPEKGEIVFLIGYRSGMLEVSWGEVGRNEDIEGEFESMGCLVVTRKRRVAGIVATENDEGFFCFNMKLIGNQMTLW